jgi:hypothetical protein
VWPELRAARDHPSFCCSVGESYISAFGVTGSDAQCFDRPCFDAQCLEKFEP